MPEIDFAEAMADQATHCYASTNGCKRFPVRMVYEMSKSEAGVVDMVMLCPDHAATYMPEGKVLSDTMLAEGDNLKMLSATNQLNLAITSSKRLRKPLWLSGNQ